jgi:large-conductance mechanosensitive channel
MESVLIFLSNLVLFLSLATLVFAIAACVAMMLKRRQPQRRKREATPPEAAQLLRRYIPPDPD